MKIDGRKWYREIKEARDGARGQTRYWVLGIMIVFGVAMFAMCSTARAEREVSISQNGTLLVKEVREVMRVPGVPKEIVDPKIADELVTGKREKYTVKKDVFGKATYTFGLPFFKKVTRYSDTVITYRQGAWLSELAQTRFERSDAEVLSVFWIWAPAILILLLSIGSTFVGTRSPFPGTRIKDLLIFYATMFVGTLAGTVIGGIIGVVDPVSGTVIGGLMGALAGGIAGGLGADYVSTSGMGLASGGFAGLYMGMIAGAFAGSQQYKIIFYFCIYLLVVEAISFCIARIFRFVIVFRRKQMKVYDA